MYEENRAPATWPRIENEFQARRMASFPKEPDAVWRDVTEEEAPAVIGTLVSEHPKQMTLLVTRNANGNLDISHRMGYDPNGPPAIGGREFDPVEQALSRKASELGTFFEECRQSGVLQEPGLRWHMTVHRDGWFYL